MIEGTTLMPAWRAAITKGDCEAVPDAYSGIENFTLAAAETRNPRHSIPMAARRIFVRILLFYVITIFMIRRYV
jgi:amino acid permease